MWCGKCQTDKETDQFSRNRTRKSGHSSYCKSCMACYDTSENSRRTSKRYYDRHKAKCFAKSNAYRASKLNATPKWLTQEMKDEIVAIYEKARSLGMEVDHIIPLKGKGVCGLHVPWNLQIISCSDNRKKSNKYESFISHDQ